MDKTLIAKRLTKYLLLTFAISCGLTFFAIQIIYSKQAGSLEGNSGIAILTIAGFFWTFVLTISSLTVFLNLYDTIRQHLLLSILTFFTLPLFVTIIFFIKSDFQEMWNSFFIITGLYFLTETYFFIKFRQTDFERLFNNIKNKVEKPAD